jgi:hypothetical protein
MNSKRYRKLTILAMVCAVFVSLPFLFGFFGNSATRVKREHGLQLPASASHFVCGGDAGSSIVDRGAASAFEIAQSDLSSFVSQLRVRSSSSGASGSIFPGNSQYQIHVPWRAAATGMTTYQCDSPTGDFLSVEVWRIDESRIGICLYTDWN